MRMRSVKETARILKEQDPNTELTEYTLRKLISEGTLPVIRTGTKFLINVDLLLDLCNGSGGLSKLNARPKEFCVEK